MEKKRSLKYLLVSVCFALLIASIGGMVIGATDNVEADATLAIKGATLDLNDKISIAYAVEASIAGYNAEDGSVANYVHIYAHNPNGTSALGEALEDYVIKNIGGVDYVLYITDGIAPTAYGENIYARLVDETNGKYGAVRKAGVLELVGNLKANLKEDDARYAIKAGLYDTILAYEEAAYKVVEGIESPYVTINVSDGKYSDGNGYYASGIVKKGTEVSFIGEAGQELDLASVNAYAAGWNLNGMVVSGNTVTINEDSELFPAYGIYGQYDGNPYTNTGSNSTNFNTNHGFYLGDIVYSKAGEGVTFAGAQLDSTYYTTKKMSVAEDGSAQWDLYDLIKPENTSKTVYPSNFWFTNMTDAGNVASISFDVRFNSVDKDGDGIYNEAWHYTPASEEEDPETGDMVVVPESSSAGDLFTQKSTVTRMMYFPIFFANKGPGFVDDITSKDNQSANEYVASECVVWVHADTIIDENGIATGWKIRTNVGADGDKNSQFTTATFSFDEWVNLEVKVLTNLDGIATGYQLLANGVVVDERLNEANIISKAIQVGGENRTANCGTQAYDLGRFTGAVSIKKFMYTAYNYYTADEIMAMEGYGKTNVSPVHMFSYEKDASARTAIDYRWNELADLPGVDQFGNYYRRDAYTTAAIPAGSWIYNKYTDSVVFGDFDNTTNAGAYAITVDNPLYGKTYEDGNTVAYEFDFIPAPTDGDNDGNYNEKGDPIPGKSSVIAGYFDFGYTSSENVTPTNTSLARLRYNVNGSISFTHAGDGGSFDASNKNNSVSVKPAQVIHIKMVITIDEAGVPETYSIYVNDTLLTTRYNGGLNGENKGGTGFHYGDISTSNKAAGSLFGQTMLGVKYSTGQSAKNMECHIYRNFKAYIVE